MITLEMKLKCIQRELAIRKNKYPKMVEKRTMRQAQADHEICVMEAIESDYLKFLYSSDNATVIRGKRGAPAKARPKPRD
jgi:hypothetical protein